MDVIVEAGAKRVFVSAVAWPGWARSARDEEGAIEALMAYAPRYRRAVGRTARDFALPARGVRVVERLPGNATTDFGAPGAIAASDRVPTSAKDLERGIRLLRACWRAFDRAAERARGATLTTGPRGGGRALDAIVGHVREAEEAYVRALGARPDAGEMREVRAAFEAGLAARTRGEIADTGPHGGARWPARFAIRRSAWHALDHAWEIEDRA